MAGMPDGMEALYADVNATRFRRSFTLSNELEADKIAAAGASLVAAKIAAKAREVQTGLNP